MAHAVEQPLAQRKRLVHVVHVQLTLQVLSVVDGGHVQRPGKHMAGGVGAAHRERVAHGARRRPVGRGDVLVARAPGVEVTRDVQRLVDLGRGGAKKREGLLFHVAGVFPAAHVPVQVQELGRRDAAALQRTQAVLHADVVPGRACVAVGLGAVDGAQVVVVRPADRGDVALRLPELLVGRRAKKRVHRQRGQAAPGLDALGAAHRGAVTQRGLQRRQRVVDDAVALFGVHADQPAAVLRDAPLGVAAVGGVHVVLQQLAVAHVDGLRHHVGVALHRQQRVQHAGLVLRDQVLLDRAARAAQAHGVQRHAVALDEALLAHHRGLAGQLHVVVRAGVVAAGVHDGVAPAQDVQVHRAAVHRALAVADGHAALEPVQQLAVPQAGVVLRGVVGLRRQHRDAVEEAVDAADLAPDDEVHRAAVGQRDLAHVGRPAAVGRHRHHGATGVAVQVGDEGVDRAVGAVADGRAAAIGDAVARRRGAVHQRLAAHRALDGGADKRHLLRAAEHRPGDRVVGEHQRAALGGQARLQPVAAIHQAGDHALQRVAAGHQRHAHERAVEPQLHVGVLGRRGADLDAGIAARHVLRRAGQHTQAQRSQRLRGDQATRGQDQELPKHPLHGFVSLAAPGRWGCGAGTVSLCRGLEHRDCEGVPGGAGSSRALVCRQPAEQGRFAGVGPARAHLSHRPAMHVLDVKTPDRHDTGAGTALPLRLLLRFSDAAFELRFVNHYVAFYFRYAQVSLLLGVLLVAGDYLVDRIAHGSSAANLLRLTTAVPVLLAGLGYSLLPKARRHWQPVMASFIVTVALCLIAHPGAHRRRGRRRPEELGRRAQLHLPAVLLLRHPGRAVPPRAGVGRRHHGAPSCTRCGWHAGLSTQQAAYWSYHVVTVFILAAGIGWWREFVLRKEFMARAALDDSRVAAEQRALRLAHYDEVTGLPNRRLFAELAAPALERSRRSGAGCAVLHVEIDRLGGVNDVYGRVQGDVVLAGIAQRLRACIRGGDLAAAHADGRGAGRGGAARRQRLLDPRRRSRRPGACVRGRAAPARGRGAAHRRRRAADGAVGEHRHRDVPRRRPGHGRPDRVVPNRRRGLPAGARRRPAQVLRRGAQRPGPGACAAGNRAAPGHPRRAAVPALPAQGRRPQRPPGRRRSAGALAAPGAWPAAAGPVHRAGRGDAA